MFIPCVGKLKCSLKQAKKDLKSKTGVTKNMEQI